MKTFLMHRFELTATKHCMDSMDLKKARYKQEYHFNGNTGLRKGHPRSEGLGNLPKPKRLDSPPPNKGLWLFLLKLFRGEPFRPGKSLILKVFSIKVLIRKRKGKKRKGKEINLYK